MRRRRVYELNFMSVVNKLPSKIVDVDRIAGGIENSLGGREWKKNQVIHVFIIHK